MIKIILLVLLSEIFMVVGHILFKKTTSALGPHGLGSVGGQYRFLKEVLAKPAIWLGFVAMGVGLVIWLIALAQGDLSLVFPIGSLQFVLTLFLAHVFLNEKIDRMKFLGTLLVIFGITLMAFS